SGALPRYVRDKVAQTTAERAAAREAASAAGTPSNATRAAGASPRP
ncbi:tRNA (adenosine(37)-N6)-threonylcarbamoyltransferase complex dimerization subunit type 1 TsaB, partial [Acidovorax cattleyae]|nr:tRNA (adenosine(37)-N6)-threonylcarbamoyltransferase complex dimerization subunit type 1 TsaB [Paracidovorax cattleyae]